MLWARPVLCQRRPAYWRNAEQSDPAQDTSLLEQRDEFVRRLLRRGDLLYRPADAAVLEFHFLHRTRIVEIAAIQNDRRAHGRAHATPPSLMVRASARIVPVLAPGALVRQLRDGRGAGFAAATSAGTLVTRG